ncbi:zinc dependent phospholipase C family protein [Peribacillus deserti]|uniref:Hydrolase n=1 Tax=Peribacillus deserti TaxID=673318 RepID=A0A2N5M8P7_9BACI|nr:zinc dependent phospholipase C family protein [Peribacillus deserti]PLT30712.1 hydrolase [Peribacillus deserti]
MGSRVMHAIISERILEEIEMKDKQLFFLGGMAPDAGTKEKTHWYSGNEEQYTRIIDLSVFLKQYSGQKMSPFILGYFSHLIADEIWLNGFYLPWLSNRLKADPALLARYHEDFKILNAKLTDIYTFQLPEYGASLSLVEEFPEGVTVQSLQSLLGELRRDLKFDLADIGKPLNVFTEEQIIGYIETAVEKSIFYINQNL